MAETWLLIIIPVLLIVLGIIAFFSLKGKKNFQPDYYTFFILGLVLFIIGIAAENSVMWILGIVFFILGITHKGKWKKRKTWKTMDKKERKLFMILMIILGVLLVAGIVVFLLTNNWDKLISGGIVANKTLAENNDSITGSTVNEEQIEPPYAIIIMIDDNESLE